MTESYTTLAAPCQGLVNERRSRFLAYIYPIAHEQEARPLVAAQRAEHHGARHWCYAYILGHDGEYHRVSDDGEPSGSAGRPMLGVLRSRNLTQVLAIVVRYFGGVKLGVPGLIAAYRGATEDALSRGECVVRPVEVRMALTYAYAAQHEVMGTVKATGGLVEEETYGAECRLVGRWPVGRRDEAHQRLGAWAHVEPLPQAGAYEGVLGMELGG